MKRNKMPLAALDLIISSPLALLGFIIGWIYLSIKHGFFKYANYLKWMNK